MSGLGLSLVLPLAAGISCYIIVVLLPLLHRYAMVHPNARSSHRRATPQGAGLAVIVATLLVAAIAVAAGAHDTPFDPASLWPVFAATLFIMLVGAVDDIFTIEVVPRLLMQALAVVIMIASLPTELRVVPMLPWWTERALLLIASMWFVNLTNFMDGIDLMTVAEFVPMAVGLAVIGILGHALPQHGFVVAMALAGGLLGFAPFNKPVAHIFLGDVGSLPIGLLFAWLLLLVAGHGHLVAALVLPLYYLADATLTLFRRAIHREKVWQAHRTHFYQRATDNGWSVPKIVAHVFSVNAVLVILAIVSVLRPGLLGTTIALAGSAIAVGWLLYRFSSPQKPGQP